MKYVILAIILAILKDSHPLNPEIIKYDKFLKNFEASGRALKQEGTNKKMNGSIMKRESKIEEIVLSPETKEKIQKVEDPDVRKMLEEAYKEAEKEKQLRHAREMYVNFSCGVNTIRNNIVYAYDEYECDEYARPMMFEPKIPDNITAKLLRKLKYGDAESRFHVKLFYQWSMFLKDNRNGTLTTGLKLLKLLQQYRGRTSLEDITDDDIERLALSLALNHVFAYKFQQDLHDAIIRRSAELQKEKKKVHLFDLLNELNILEMWGFREVDLHHLNMLRQVIGFPPDLHAWFFQINGVERGVPFISSDYCPGGYGTTPSSLRVQK